MQTIVVIVEVIAILALLRVFVKDFGDMLRKAKDEFKGKPED